MTINKGSNLCKKISVEKTVDRLQTKPKSS